MADKPEVTTTSPDKKSVVSAKVAADGKVIVPCCEAELVSVDIADVDLLLGFADGSYVVIPNGALDALGDSPPEVIFVDPQGDAFSEAHFHSDHTGSLADLFKMVGATDVAKAGSLRVISENVDAERNGVDDGDVEEAPVETSPQNVVVEVPADGNGDGDSGLIPVDQMIDSLISDPVANVIPSRPSTFSPGQEVIATSPTIRLDASMTPDDLININEA
ncbi:MAG: hypothetical protein C0624_00255, partial [Desulfuromonas sp.]